MFELTTLIITAILCLLAGAILGIIANRSMSAEQQSNRDLEKRLEKAEEKLGDYQHKVSEHFAETSQLVNNLTQSYKEVHEYLASSALDLTNPDISRKLIEAGDGNLKSATHTEVEDAPIEAPRDWAPKPPGQKGQLSEDFGLHGDNEDQRSHA